MLTTVIIVHYLFYRHRDAGRGIEFQLGALRPLPGPRP
jgi:hypothetical protein